MSASFRKYQSILFSYEVSWEESLSNSYQCLSLKGPFLPAASQTGRRKSVIDQTNRKPCHLRWYLGLPQCMSLLLREHRVRAWGCSPWQSPPQARDFQSWRSEQACWPKSMVPRPESLILLWRLAGHARQQTWEKQRNPEGIFTVELKQHGSEEAKDRTVDYPIFNKDGRRGVKKRTLKWVGKSTGVGRKRPSIPDSRPLLRLLGFLHLCWALPSGLSSAFFPVSSLAVAPTNPVIHVLALLSLGKHYSWSQHHTQNPKASYALIIVFHIKSTL